MPGVFVSSGMDLRVSNISFNLKTGEVAPVTIDVRLDTWNHWLYVARESRDKAEADLVNVLEASERNDDNALGGALEEEFRHGMVAVSAAAFAIDSFYASVKERHGAHPQAVEWQAGRLARYKQVSETFRWAWNIKSQNAGMIRDALRQLYKFRDVAIHAPAEFRQPIERPDIQRGVEWRFVQFRAENARTAVQIASEVIEALLRNSRNAPPALREWVVNSRTRFVDAAGYDVRELADPPPEAVNP
jgi:hypothetical protein